MGFGFESRLDEDDRAEVAPVSLTAFRRAPAPAIKGGLSFDTFNSKDGLAVPSESQQWSSIVVDPPDQSLFLKCGGSNISKTAVGGDNLLSFVPGENTGAFWIFNSSSELDSPGE